METFQSRFRILARIQHVFPGETQCPSIPAEKAQADPSDANTWKNGTVTYTVEPNQYKEYVVEYTGQATEMAVASVKDVYGNQLQGSDYKVVYYVDNADGSFNSEDAQTTAANSGAKENGAAPVNPGNYFIAVWAGSETPENDLANAATKQVIVQAFEIARADFSGIAAYEYTGSSASATDDTSDTTFVYTAAPQKVGFAIDGKALDPKNYKVVWNTTAEQAGGTAGAAPKAAGDYVANVIGNAGTPYAGATASVPVTVEKFDIADITIGDASESSASTKFSANENMFYDGKQLGASLYTEIVTDGTVSAVSLVKPDGTVLTGSSDAAVKDSQRGAYTYSFAPSAASKGNYEGERQLSFNVVGTAYTFSNATYDGTALNGSEIEINLTDGDVLDPSLFAISDLDQKKGDFSVSIAKDGQTVTSYDEPGEYTATVSVRIPNDYSVGGKFTQKFVVTRGTVTADSIFVAVDGKNALSTTSGSLTPIATYDGKEVPAVVVVKANDAVLSEGTDYTVEIAVQNGANWDAVDEAVNAGVYQVTVTPSVAYGGEAAAQKFYFEIDKLTLASAKEASEYGIVYTGEPVTPSFIGLDADGNEFALTSDDITVEYFEGEWDAADKKWEKGSTEVAYDKIVDASVYFAELSVKSTSVNFSDITAKDVQFSVVKSVAYADVAADVWYADEVALASSDGYGYMTGIPGTNLFMPEAQITRAQVAQVLYNMAGPDLPANGTYPTGFSDVEADAWYAAPIFWASQAGIVTGYGDTGLFGPNDKVTREQAATMLYRYVKAQGKDASTTADLSGYTDGASVSDWAAEAMQWAVANDVFGVGTDQLRPQDDLFRAEMAAIAVRVQPDGAYAKLS